MFYIGIYIIYILGIRMTLSELGEAGLRGNAGICWTGTGVCWMVTMRVSACCRLLSSGEEVFMRIYLAGWGWGWWVLLNGEIWGKRYSMKTSVNTFRAIPSSISCTYGPHGDSLNIQYSPLPTQPAE